MTLRPAARLIYTNGVARAHSVLKKCAWLSLQCRKWVLGYLSLSVPSYRGLPRGCLD